MGLLVEVVALDVVPTDRGHREARATDAVDLVAFRYHEIPLAASECLKLEACIDFATALTAFEMSDLVWVESQSKLPTSSRYGLSPMSSSWSNT